MGSRVSGHNMDTMSFSLSASFVYDYSWDALVLFMVFTGSLEVMASYIIYVSSYYYLLFSVQIRHLAS